MRAAPESPASDPFGGVDTEDDDITVSGRSEQLESTDAAAWIASTSAPRSSSQPAATTDGLTKAEAAKRLAD